MAEMIQFDLVSPEKMLTSMQASAVEIPGAEGDFTAMAEHQAMITTMRPGILKVKGKADTAEYVVTGGFVEVSATATSILAEVAIPRGDITRQAVDDMVTEAEKAAENASEAVKDAANKRVADTKTLLDILGL